MSRFRPSPPDRSVVFSPAESEDAGGQEVAKGVSHSPPTVPVKPAGGVYGNRSVHPPTNMPYAATCPAVTNRSSSLSSGTNDQRTDRATAHNHSPQNPQGP
jgi:hypothetical protein